MESMQKEERFAKLKKKSLTRPLYPGFLEDQKGERRIEPPKVRLQHRSMSVALDLKTRWAVTSFRESILGEERGKRKAQGRLGRGAGT